MHSRCRHKIEPACKNLSQPRWPPREFSKNVLENRFHPHSPPRRARSAAGSRRLAKLFFSMAAKMAATENFHFLFTFCPAAASGSAKWRSWSSRRRGSAANPARNSSGFAIAGPRLCAIVVSMPSATRRATAFKAPRQRHRIQRTHSVRQPTRHARACSFCFSHRAWQANSTSPDHLLTHTECQFPANVLIEFNGLREKTSNRRGTDRSTYAKTGLKTAGWKVRAGGKWLSIDINGFNHDAQCVNTRRRNKQHKSKRGKAYE